MCSGSHRLIALAIINYVNSPKITCSQLLSIASHFSLLLRPAAVSVVKKGRDHPDFSFRKATKKVFRRATHTIRHVTRISKKRLMRVHTHACTHTQTRMHAHTHTLKHTHSVPLLSHRPSFLYQGPKGLLGLVHGWSPKGSPVHNRPGKPPASAQWQQNGETQL